MSLYQLNPTIPVTVIGKGDGYAIAIIDYGQEHNLIWVTALNESAEVWCAPNPLVRMKGNWTMGRERPFSMAVDDFVPEKARPPSRQMG